MRTTACTLAALSTLILASCASVKSIPLSLTANDLEKGLVYFLPKESVIVSLTVDDKGKRTVTVRPTAPMADHTAGFIAQFKRTQIATNKLTVEVNRDQLLHGAVSNLVTPKVAETLGAAADSIARSSMLRVTRNLCEAAGTYEFIIDPTTWRNPTASGENPYDPNEGWSYCGDYDLPQTHPGSCRLFVHIVGAAPRSGDDTCMTATLEPAPGERRNSAHGFFYRLPRTYQVIVSQPESENTNKPKMITNVLLSLVTSESTTMELPVPRGFAAKSDAQFTFDAGRPTKYIQELDSEWLGIAKLPATVIGAYFEAIGRAWTSRSAEYTNETSYLNNARANELASTRLEACKEAMDAYRAQPNDTTRQAVTTMCGS